MKEPVIYRVSSRDEYFFREGCYITELMNTPDSPDLSIARVRLPAGRSTRWHTLTATHERYVIQQGEATAETGQLQQRVGPGDVVCIPPGCPQRITAHTDLEFLALCTPRFIPDNYTDTEDDQ